MLQDYPLKVIAETPGMGSAGDEVCLSGTTLPRLASCQTPVHSVVANLGTVPQSGSSYVAFVSCELVSASFSAVNSVLQQQRLWLQWEMSTCIFRVFSLSCE